VPAVEECGESEDRIQAVLRLSKQAKSTVGFMPDSAFRERAAKGTLLVAVEAEELLGYVLYDLPRDEVAGAAARHRSLASQRGCSPELDRRAREATSGKARDLPWVPTGLRPERAMAKAWICPLGERAGRGHKALPLTIWRRDFSHPTLFTAEPIKDRPVAALDVNIVIQMADSVPDVVEPLLSDWIQNAVELAVTDEVVHETAA
jgi:hypothetical protein